MTIIPIDELMTYLDSILDKTVPERAKIRAEKQELLDAKQNGQQINEKKLLELEQNDSYAAGVIFTILRIENVLHNLRHFF